MISVIIPTRGTGDCSKLLKLLESLSHQTNKQNMLIEQVLIIIDFDISRKYLLDQLHGKFKNLHIEVVCQDGYGVSAARNWGAAHASGDYILLCDDDIIFQEKDLLDRLLDEYHRQRRKIQDQSISSKVNKEGKDFNERKYNLILYPTILFRDTGNIQTQGFISYNRLMCWPVPKHSIDRKSKFRAKLTYTIARVLSIKSAPNQQIQLIGSICVFAKRQTLLENPYNEAYDFIYEDLEWSYRAYKKGISIINTEDIQIQHREKQKDILAWSYIDNPDNVYRKTKHRIWFILTHATTWQLLAFYCVGFWLSNGWTLLHILIYGKRKNKLIKAWWKGIGEGLTSVNNTQI